MPTLRTVTIRSAGGDYTSLQAAITAESKDLVALDRVLRFDCGDLQDTSADLTGFTTDTTRYIEVVATSKHNGTWSTNAYRMVANPAYDTGVLRINSTQHVVVDSVQCEHTRAVGGRAIGIDVYGTGTATVVILNPICRYTQAGTETEIEAAGIRVRATAAASVFIINPLTYRYGGGIVKNGGTYSAALRLYIYNPTCVDNQVNQINLGDMDPLSGAIVKLRNAIMQGSGVNYVPPQSSGANYVTSTNLTQDATSPEAGLRNLSVTFVDTGNRNYALASGDTTAQNAGTNLSADADYPFSTDIIGTTRPQGAAWDIGAFERIVATGNAGNIFNYSNTGRNPIRLNIGTTPNGSPFRIV